ncbi:hypothetical protein GWK47_052744 [Chionoecetes opilio]|uniref:Uncharacterized protein n=1 Tax=Chionoecetes opilio TaxID=41210 RepID=A0A8J4Y660_CHIOP|nr:hypothetical protein GWK47_052744 [Chionoecetes opilio]
MLAGQETTVRGVQDPACTVEKARRRCRTRRRPHNLVAVTARLRAACRHVSHEKGLSGRLSCPISFSSIGETPTVMSGTRNSAVSQAVCR